MHVIVALYAKPLLAIGLFVALGIPVAETTGLRGSIAEHAMARQSLHRAGFCARSTMPGCRLLLPDERPDRVVKESKVQRARRGTAQAIVRFSERNI